MDNAYIIVYHIQTIKLKNAPIFQPIDLFKHASTFMLDNNDMIYLVSGTCTSQPH